MLLDHATDDRFDFLTLRIAAQLRHDADDHAARRAGHRPNRQLAARSLGTCAEGHRLQTVWTLALKDLLAFVGSETRASALGGSSSHGFTSSAVVQETF